MTKYTCSIFLTFFLSSSLLGQISLLKEINLDDGSKPNSGFIYNNQFYFSADDGINGDELWKTDGTPGGTQFVADIAPGSDSSSPAYFIELNGGLFFYGIGEGFSINLYKLVGNSVDLMEASTSLMNIAKFGRPLASCQTRQVKLLRHYRQISHRDLWATL